MPNFSSRLLRRVIIAVIFLAVFFLFGYGTRQLTQPTATCTDGVKNGDEEGIDCGLFACQNYCEPDLDSPKVVSTKLIEARENDYDFVAEIQNPHSQFGAPEVIYELTVYNGGDEILNKIEGLLYILPGQTKYLIIPSLLTDRRAERTELIIKSARWQKIDSLEGLNLVVRREKYNLAVGGDSSTLDAVIFNDSDFDFEVVDIEVVLFDSRNNILGVNKSDIRTFVAGTERHFVVAWPFPLGDRVARTEIRVATNLFENSNFIKSYGSEVQKFQEYPSR